MTTLSPAAAGARTLPAAGGSLSEKEEEEEEGAGLSAAFHSEPFPALSSAPRSCSPSFPPRCPRPDPQQSPFPGPGSPPPPPARPGPAAPRPPGRAGAAQRRCGAAHRHLEGQEAARRGRAGGERGEPGTKAATELPPPPTLQEMRQRQRRCEEGKREPRTAPEAALREEMPGGIAEPVSLRGKGHGEAPLRHGTAATGRGSREAPPARGRGSGMFRPQLVFSPMRFQHGPAGCKGHFV